MHDNTCGIKLQVLFYPSVFFSGPHQRSSRQALRNRKILRLFAKSFSFLCSIPQIVQKSKRNFVFFLFLFIHVIHPSFFGTVSILHFQGFRLSFRKHLQTKTKIPAQGRNLRLSKNSRGRCRRGRRRSAAPYKGCKGRFFLFYRLDCRDKRLAGSIHDSKVRNQ